MANYVPQSGDLIWLDFTPQSGHEQRGKRPALVLSPKEYNQKSGLCLCVPLTSKIKGYPFEVPCVIGEKEGVILSDQLRNVDFKARGANFIEQCEKEVLEQVKCNLALLLGI
ncbi:endoribonuclease MazF [Helicobacter sp. UBA3407]|uniref:endoribonuclease MazF n=1 Tax=Helicobacter TaxID=209 RepID=UPI00263765AC|nr:endoribonuclease MazF [Helicobacter sp. UBA3407]